MKMELVMMVLFGIGLVFGMVLGFGIFSGNETFIIEEPEVVGPDLNYLNQRFDKLEVGIQNSSIDFCLKNNGFYLADTNNNLVVRTLDIPIDQNAGIFRKVNTITCIFPAN